MYYRILYEPFKTLEEQDKAEQHIKREIPMAIYDERSELDLAIRILQHIIIFTTSVKYDNIYT